MTGIVGTVQEFIPKRESMYGDQDTKTTLHP